MFFRHLLRNISFLVILLVGGRVELCWAKSVALLDPLTQPKFVNPLPFPGVAQPDTPGGTSYTISASQFQQDLGLKDPLTSDPLLTTVWGYNGSYPGPTIEATRGTPVNVTWTNDLVSRKYKPLPHLLPVDTSIHWAFSYAPYTIVKNGVPIVTHLHGGHTEAASDGTPDQWFFNVSEDAHPIHLHGVHFQEIADFHGVLSFGTHAESVRLGRRCSHMEESRLEPTRDHGYKCSSMSCPAHRNLLARSLAFALIVATQLSSVSIAAEPLVAPPAPEGTDSTELPTRLPPVNEYDASFDVTEELPLELKLESDEEAAKPRRGGRGGMGGPMGGGGPPIGYRAFGEPTVGVEGQSTAFEHWAQEASIAFPAWTAEPHLLLVSTSIVNDLYDTAAIFPRNGLEFPESLWNIRLGMNYFRELQSDWKIGTGLNIGSASDRPFAALRDVNPAMFTFLSIPSRAQNSWNLSVFYSPISEIPFPIPGVAYYWYVSEALQMNIGLPAQLTWQPTERFTFAASYMILHTITARGSWQLDQNWSTYLSYENRNRAWFLNDRERDDERLFSYDQALLVGLQRTFFEKFPAEVTAGYMFNRFYFIGEDYSDRNLNRIDIDSGLTVSAQIGVGF